MIAYWETFRRLAVVGLPAKTLLQGTITHTLAFPKFLWVQEAGFQPPYLACIFVYGHLSAISVYGTLIKTSEELTSPNKVVKLAYSCFLLRGAFCSCHVEENSGRFWRQSDEYCGAAWRHESRGLRPASRFD